jgi:uncharacterized protein YndB with AHSA1/START domain
MAEVRASATRSVPAPVEKVYGLVSDSTQRTKLLPPAYSEVSVIVGGSDGEPTVVRYRLHAGGRERDYAMRQVPGTDSRSWREEDEGSSLVTTWTLTPGSAGNTRVEITTTWQGAGGIGGFFEKTFAPLGVRRLHQQTLENLVTTLAT